ncbi:hypothetical protein MLD38_000175 [Melastoma candidum]|uniref:Uncharacterized protein n=1 Tax=Melastoma candidum TaxID=119954 RepID=A0ACB9SA67_9MYRT|nr:hypothetical protein MLD38_000175 [Melastoma candidum]
MWQQLVVWMRQQLEDYDLHFNNIPIMCDNTSAINLSQNHVYHSRSKHIELRYHFLRDHIQSGRIDIQYVNTEQQLTDILTKPLDKKMFEYLRNELGICNPNYGKAAYVEESKRTKRTEVAPAPEVMIQTLIDSDVDDADED